MKFRTLFLSFLLVPALLPAQAAEVRPAADELAMGKMWTFENPPLGYLEREYGFRPDQKWLDSLRLAALRLGERDNPWCSASFVSPKGLVMTNHHCVRDKIAEAQGVLDWVKDGYVASALEDEVRLPGLTVQQLLSQRDVSADVDAGIEDGDDDATIASKRKQNRERIEAEAEAAHPDQLHQVVMLYHGAQHLLYSYRIYQDVRLVMAPNLQTAHFGGDPDNFTYPRWSIDFAFVRAYENDQPADTAANYFRWRQDGVREGELVFVPGNPGSTDRLLTHAQMAAARDAEYPITLGLLANGLQILRHFADQDPAIEKSLLPTILNWENSRKAFAGMLGGLRDQAMMDLRLQKELKFRAAIDADPELKAKFGDLWDRLADIAGQKRALHPSKVFHAPSYSSVIERGVAVVRAVDPSLPESEREEAKAEALGMRMGGNPITLSLLADHFLRARDWLPADDPYLTVLLGDGGFPQAMEKLGGSALGRRKTVQELLDGGAEAVQQSDDFGVVVARTLWPLMRDTQRRLDEVETAEKVLLARMGRALFAVFGTKVAPDATMTLRFSDGLVQGYPYNGTLAPWATCLFGLYGRSLEFGNQYPFDLAQPWVEAKDKVDLTARVCFASTNDIIGGNSGSVVVDKDLQVVGLVFDGNIESLPNNFWYLRDNSRAVSVHTDAIWQALTVVYGAQRVADELQAK